MGLFSSIYGVNQNAKETLARLGLERSGIDRFCDCYQEGDAIIILVREGGKDTLSDHPAYVRSEPDAFSFSYVRHYFEVPDDEQKRHETSTIRTLHSF